MKTTYIDLNFKPDYKKQIIAHFYLEAEGSYRDAAEQVAAESSIGSWTELTTMKRRVIEKLRPTVFYLNEHERVIKIVYPLDLFEMGSVPQFLSGVGGNVFSMKLVKNLRLFDIDLPEKYIAGFDGPEVGAVGIRKILKNKNRIILGSIIKPKVGLNPTEQAELSYQVWKNGIDLIKDDENLTSMTFNNFEERVTRVLKMAKRAERETGEIKVYAANVTGTPDVMLQRAKLVKKLGGRCAMVDIVSCGLGSVQYLRKQNLGLIIHGHRAGHSTFTRDPKHGISMMVLAKLSRLVGIDQLHTGTVVGKMEGDSKEVKPINDFLTAKWGKLKSVLPIASGGLHPALLPELEKILGANLIANFGAGIHGHRDGSAAGSRACRQAADAIAKKISLVEYAKTHEELAVALEQWGEIRY